MSTAEYEVLLTPQDRHEDGPSGAALYALMRSEGSWAVVARAVGSQFAMAFVILVFYVLGVAVNYGEMHARLNHPLCPNATVNNATLWQVDCWGDEPINMFRQPSDWVLVVLALLGASMLWEMLMVWATVMRHRRTEAWLTDNGLSMDRGWDAFVEVCGGGDFDITRKADMFIDLYTRVLPVGNITRTLHTSIDVVLYMVRNLGWEPGAATVAVGLLGLVGMPYVMVSKLCRYVFRNSQELKTGNVFAQRHMSRRALWKLRGIGEPTHLFEHRAREIAKEATELLDSLPLPPLIRAMANLVMVVGGAFTGAVLLLSAAVDEQVLTTDLTPGRTVAFYATIVGVVLASVAPSIYRTKRLDHEDYIARIEAIAAKAPGLLGGGSNHDEQCAIISQSMHYWIVDLASELVSVVTVPFYLLFFLDLRAFNSCGGAH